jgi:hypothetical protein
MLALFTAFAYQIGDIVDMSRIVKSGRGDRYRPPPWTSRGNFVVICSMASTQNISNSHLYDLNAYHVYTKSLACNLVRAIKGCNLLAANATGT